MGLIIIQFVVGGGFPTGENEEAVPSSLLLAALAGVSISVVVRWLILPKVTKMESLLPVMIVGLALAESSGILGIFLIGPKFPETQQLVLLLSLAGIIQFIPLYLSKFKENDNPFIAKGQ